MPIHHVAVLVSDIKKSREFYDPVLAACGYVVSFAYDQFVYYAPASNPRAAEFGLTLADPSKTIGSTHVAFGASSQSEVAEWYQVAIKSGGKDNGAPGIRKEYNEGYYGAFVHDPDGHNIEFVHIDISCKAST
ncbi:Glyoxalase/Bleomycin resistance protein/Dihydroxybiphenyl dioxygenase [Lipomyces chichibuensis]|uniref:Glyoxalase/Bleomycin resistance protein/Dihydroxybiphenyl dioxygenase n=1 Tax=Lipomyces chichibuensis TaxID=1546026 RepID=UPI003343F773